MPFFSGVSEKLFISLYECDNMNHVQLTDKAILSCGRVAEKSGGQEIRSGRGACGMDPSLMSENDAKY